MALKTNFKSFAHAIAAGAKYLEIGILDILKASNKVQTVAPEVEAVVGLVAGPQAEAIADLSFRTLGNVAQAIQTSNTDALNVVSTKGLNVQMDMQTVTDIKAAVATIQQVLALRGTPAPALAVAAAK